MTASPGSPERKPRRPMFGAAISMAAFLLLAQPLFLLGPLFLLLVLSFPKTAREWLWIGVTAFGISQIVVGLTQPPMAGRMVLAAAVMMSGFFSVACLTFPRTTTLSRITVALVLTGTAIVSWTWHAGISLNEVLAAAKTALEQDAERAFTGKQLTTFMAVIEQISMLFPAQIAIQAAVGAAMAWQWFGRITASRPAIGLPFRAFRFNDHLIWGAIITGALALTALPNPWTTVVWNVTAAWITLYFVRGLAVFAFLAGYWSRPQRVFVTVMILMILPIGVAFLLAIGLGDTWLDFRNRNVAFSERPQ